MRKDRTQPEILPTLEVSDGFRHPMWNPPDTAETPHAKALRAAIKKALTPFDGRPDSEFVTGFCEEVYELTRGSRQDVEPTANFIWTLGKIEWRRHHWTTSLANHIAQRGPLACMPANVPVYRQSIEVINRLAREFSEAVCQSVST